jgi:hypothetical protein
MGNATAQNAFLAASGRHLHTTRGSFQVTETLRYRSAAIRGLQKASMDGSMSRDSSMITLTTILGLLVDDAIGDTKDYPMLLRLVETWARMGGSEEYKSSNLSIKFLLEQIQMYEVPPSKVADIGLISSVSKDKNPYSPTVPVQRVISHISKTADNETETIYTTRPSA